MPRTVAALVRRPRVPATFVVTALAALLVLGGCGGAGDRALPAGSTAPTGVPGVTADPTALAAWDGFPADRRPRPIVVGDLPVIPQDGFRDSETKDAVGNGRYRLAAPLPPDPPATVAVALPDGQVVLPTSTAAAAFAAMAAAGSAGAPGDAATISAVRLGTASFGTDRGAVTLPAWLFSSDGATGPLAWPALAPSALWRVRGSLPTADARVSADGRTLTVTLAQTPVPGCPGTPAFHYTATAVESAHAVVVGLQRVDDGVVPGPPDANCGRPSSDVNDLVLVVRTAAYPVQLAAPLGGRVLLGPGAEGPPVVMSVLPG